MEVGWGERLTRFRRPASSATVSAVGFTSGLLAVGCGLASAGFAIAGAVLAVAFGLVCAGFAAADAGALVDAGGWASSSFIFCRRASRALAMLSESAGGWAAGAGDGWAAGSAARSGRTAAQNAAAQTSRKDFEICMGAFLRQNGRRRNSFPGWNHLFPRARPGIKQDRPQHESAGPRAG